MSTGSYLDNTSNRQGLERFAGVTLTRPGNRHIVQKPSSDKGVSQFRIYPYVENGQEKPLRLEPNVYRERVGQHSGPTCDYAFYPWIAQEDAVFMAGTSSKFTAFARVRDKDVRFQGPFHKFFRGMNSALKANPNAYPRDWADWIKPRGALPKVESVGLIQGILYTFAGKAVADVTGKPAPQHPTLLILSKTARESLEQLCNQRYPSAQADNEDFDQVFPYNRLVDSQKGSLITIIYHPASSRNTTYYEIQVDQQVLPIAPQLAQEFVPWSSLLYYMTEVEQIETLCAHFPAEAVDFILGSGEFADLLPSTIRGRWDQFVRSGGQHQPAPPQQQYPQQPLYAAPAAAPAPAYQPPPQQQPQEPWAQPAHQAAPPPPPPPAPPYQAPTAPPAPQQERTLYQPNMPQTLPAGAPPLPNRAATSPALHGAPAFFTPPSIQNQLPQAPTAPQPPAGPAATVTNPTEDQSAALLAARARLLAAQGNK